MILIESLLFLVLPLPIIRGFIYDGERPNYMNYGALGSIIGHEFTHSFTLTGDHSYPVNNTWMTNSSMTKFHEKVQCVIEEYDKYLNVTEGLHKVNLIVVIHLKIYVLSCFRL